jgi:hypothetical protein
MGERLSRGGCGLDGRRRTGERVSRGDGGLDGRRRMGEGAFGGDCGAEGRRWIGERASREDCGLDGRRGTGERASGGDCGLEGRRRTGERVSRGDGARTADRVLMLPPGRGMEGTPTFGVRSGLCVCVREGGRGDRDGAGLRTAFLEGARDGVGLASRGFAAAADGRLRGKNMDIGLREEAFEEGRGRVCALSGGGRTRLVSLEGLFERRGQTWSPSWSRGTGCVQEEHLTVGRRWDMRSVGGLGASWAIIDNK